MCARKLNKELLELQGCYQVLEEELEASRQETSDIREAHAGQKQALERENDLLREQLKKYVGMVQAQRKETQVRNSDSLTSGTSGLSLQAASLPLLILDYHCRWSCIWRASRCNHYSSTRR